jgi:hypothetical protein
MLTANDLGISQAEYEALQVVRDGLASGEFSHDDSKRFDMNITCDVDDCGTVACIGGWVAVVMGRDKWEANRYVLNMELGDALYPLYYPDDMSDWSRITPAVAAATITSFLDSGEADFAAHI